MDFVHQDEREPSHFLRPATIAKQISIYITGLSQQVSQAQSTPDTWSSSCGLCHAPSATVNERAFCNGVTSLSSR